MFSLLSLLSAQEDLYGALVGSYSIQGPGYRGRSDADDGKDRNRVFSQDGAHCELQPGG